MAQGRVEHLDRILWNHTSSIYALIYNVNCKRSEQIKARDVNPYYAKKTTTMIGWQEMTEEEREAIRKAFRKK